MSSYLEFKIQVDVSGPNYRVHARSPEGEATCAFELPFSDATLGNFMEAMGLPVRKVRGGGAYSKKEAIAKEFGSKLFEAVFVGEVRDLYKASQAQARNAPRQPLRITFSLAGAPKLQLLPWEFLYDHPSFLAVSTWTPIVRYLDLPKPPQSLGITLPLKILGMVAAPIDQETLDVDKEKATLEKALDRLRPNVTIDWMKGGRLGDLNAKLRADDYHVFHFIGHGEYNEAHDEGYLLFEDENRRTRQVTGNQLGNILRDEDTLRLVVLNSCEGAAESSKDPFSGVASQLIEHEIPAIVAMQFSITDDAAITFAKAFYEALAQGRPVDNAIAEGRKDIYAEYDLEFATPVLFMRVADGQLFDITAPRIGTSRQPTKLVSKASVPVSRVGNPPPANLERARPADGDPAPPTSPAKAAAKPASPAIPAKAAAKPASPAKARAEADSRQRRLRRISRLRHPTSPAKAAAKPASATKSAAKPASPAKAPAKPASSAKAPAKPAIPAKSAAKPASRGAIDGSWKRPPYAPFGVLTHPSLFDKYPWEPLTTPTGSPADAAASVTSSGISHRDPATGEDGYGAFLVRYPEWNKADVVKAVRGFTNLDLKEARDLVAAPNPILQGISKEKAESIKATLEELGAMVEVVEPGRPLPGSRQWSAVRVPSAFVRLRVTLSYEVHVIDFRISWTDTLHLDNRLIERKFITGGAYKFALQDGPHSRAAKLMTSDGITVIVDDKVLFQGPYGAK